MVQEKYLVIMMRIAIYGAILIVAWSLIGCGHGRQKYELYVHDAARQLFIRDLVNKDVLTYEQADGLICQKPEDVKRLIKESK